jgi:hypothetical protein
MNQEMRLRGQDTHYWEAYTSFAEDRIRRDFDWLVGRGILRQGTEIRCRNCGSYYWYDVERIRPHLSCTGCGGSVTLPTECPWSYRLNDLAANALQSHGTLAVLQALYMLESEARGRLFLALPCQNLAEEHDGPPCTDLDIVALVDNRFVIGEAKSSPRSFREASVERVTEVAEEIRPDELIFAAPGNDWPEDVLKWIGTAGERLEPLGVKTRELRMRWS